MAYLNIKLDESKTEILARVHITCSADVSDEIRGHVMEAFELDLLISGFIKSDPDKCVIKFTLTDEEKIKMLRVGIMRAITKNTFSEN